VTPIIDRMQGVIGAPGTPMLADAVARIITPVQRRMRPMVLSAFDPVRVHLDSTN
jgi:hypothetical protein